MTRSRHRGLSAAQCSDLGPIWLPCLSGEERPAPQHTTGEGGGAGEETSRASYQVVLLHWTESGRPGSPLRDTGRLQGHRQLNGPSPLGSGMQPGRPPLSSQHSVTEASPEHSTQLAPMQGGPGSSLLLPLLSVRDGGREQEWGEDTAKLSPGWEAISSPTGLPERLPDRPALCPAGRSGE